MHRSAHLFLTLALLTTPVAIAQVGPPATLVGLRLSLDRSHTGRVGHHTYTLTPRQGRLVALFAPHPLANGHAAVATAAVHLLRRAFGADLSSTAPVAITLDGVAAQTYQVGATTYYVMPIRNARGLVHSLVLWVGTGPGPSPS